MRGGRLPRLLEKAARVVEGLGGAPPVSTLLLKELNRSPVIRRKRSNIE